MRRPPQIPTYRPRRYAIAVPCQVVRERDFRLVADRLTDLSISGAYVTPAEPVLTGEPLLVSFQLPRGEGWFDAEATVQRVAHGRRTSEHARSLGISFDRHLGDSLLLLVRTLRGLPPTPPRWRPGRRDARLAVERLARTSSRAFSFSVAPSPRRAWAIVTR